MELQIAFIHLDVLYKNGDQNKKNLLRYIREAAENGAGIVLTPEMAVSGYSFQNRADIADAVEDEDGDFICELSSMAEDFDCYICVGLALRQKTTGAYCNSAIVVGPGNFFLRYDKVNGEIRWSRPGDPNQVNSFDTPWGKVGVLICSDTYYDLQPRIAALQGVDLMLVPANWPPSGLDPVELWRARAFENGVAIAACNRTGKDLNMSCESAESCLISSAGEVIFRQNSPTTMILANSLPLADGQLCSASREKRLQTRAVEDYHSCYKNINIVGDLTSFFDLPSVGGLSINCLVNGSHSTAETLEQLDADIQKHTSQADETTGALWLLSFTNFLGNCREELSCIAKENRVWLSVQETNPEPVFHLFGPTECMSLDVNGSSQRGSTPYPYLDIGPARVAFMPYEALLHPENAVAASKDGCDLIVVCSDSFSDDSRLICGVRTISHLGVAMCTERCAGIWMRPEGHARWGEIIQDGKGCCSFMLDTGLTRKKRFQDRLDLDRLLKTT